MSKKKGRRSTLVGMDRLIDTLRQQQAGGVIDPGLVGIWRQVIDHPELLANSRPDRIDGETLVVHVSTPAWAARIRMTAPSLLSAMKDAGLQDAQQIDVKVIPQGFIPSS